MSAGVRTCACIRGAGGSRVKINVVGQFLCIAEKAFLERRRGMEETRHTTGIVERTYACFSLVGANTYQTEL